MPRPGLGTHLSLGTRQELALAPRMLQSVEVLQLPAGDLEAWLLEQAESNEALCLDPPASSEDRTAATPDLPARRPDREATEAHDEMLRNQPDRAAGLAEELEPELAATGLEGSRLEWARFLIGCLDERGYLSAPDEVLLEQAREAELPGGAAALGLAIADLQSLEPRGLGARDAIEALLLQLDPDDPDYGLLCRLLEEFVEELARNHWPDVARAMDLEMPDLQRLLAILGELDPRPAARLVGEDVPCLRPDVRVLPDETGRLQVELANGALPAVAVDETLRSLARDREQPADVRRYARERVDGARAVVDAVRQRGETLLAVSRALFAHQRAYLEHGPGHLVPLKMTALAEELGLHVSTVSRCVAGKYAQTPWGIEPLRGFFQSAAGGGDAARGDVREVVREVFAAEDPTAPLSDGEAAEILAARGLDLARRTVAKYRRELGIPTSYRRRRFTGS